MFCLPLPSSSNSTEQHSKASAWNASLYLPTGSCTNSFFKRRQQDLLVQKCLLCPEPSHGISREEGMFTWITTHSAAGDGSVQLWYQSRCHWITQFPQNPTTSGPEQMMWQAHPCQLQHAWCPELNRGMEKSSAGSTMLTVLLPVLKHSRKICRHRCLQHTNLAQAAGEHWAEGQSSGSTGRQTGLCSSWQQRQLFWWGEHHLVCDTNIIQIYFPLAENQCIIHSDCLV